MWYPSVVVEPPTAEVLSIEQVKRQSRIDGDDEDALIGDLIEEVTDHTERYWRASPAGADAGDEVRRLR